MGDGATMDENAGDGWADFVGWVSGDPGDVATFIGVVLTFLVAAFSGWVSWRAFGSTKVHQEREHGWTRYTTALEYIFSVPADPDKALEGVRMLEELLSSSWPTKSDREMAEGALRRYEDRLSGDSP